MTAADADTRAAQLIAAALGSGTAAATAGAGGLEPPSRILLAGHESAALLVALLDARAGHGRAGLQVVAILPPDAARHWPALRARLAGSQTDPDASRWPDSLVPGLEPLPDRRDGVRATLAVGVTAAMLRRLAGRFDRLVLSDPSALAGERPGLWQGGSLARLAAPGAQCLIAGASREALAPVLQRAGFRVEAPGSDADPGILRATPLTGRRSDAASARDSARNPARDPPPNGAPAPGRAASPRPAQALVIGAGLAGSAVAAALAARGWQVTVLDRHAAPAREGSGQPRVVDHLHLSADDNPMARLTRAAARLAAVRSWVGAIAEPLGKLILPAGPAERDALRAMLERLALPPDWARLADADEARAASGVATPWGGLWLARARVADPVRQCAAWLSRPGVAFSGGCEVAALRHRDGVWEALAHDGRLLGCAPVAILAAATGSPSLGGCASIALERLAGQTTLLAGPPLDGLRSALGGAAYACPQGDGRVLVGSTFSEADAFAPDAAGDADNVARIAGALGVPADTLMPGIVSRHGGVRCATRDRLPAAGPMPDEAAIAARVSELSGNDRLPLPRRPGLYGAFGMGARGLLWSVLAAEVIAAQVSGELPPLERDLLDAIDPARFARAALRRGRFAA